MERRIPTAPRARITCNTRNELTHAALTKAFARACYALAKPNAPGHSDLGLVDLRGEKISTRAAKSIAAAFRKKSPDCFVLFLIDPTISVTARTALRRFGEVIPVIDDFDHAVERCRHIIRLRNIAEEAGERMKSLASLNRLVEFPAIATENTPLQILIAGKPGPAALAVTAAISKIVDQTVCVFSAGQMLRALDHGRFDCVIIPATEENDPIQSLIRSMRRHPVHCGVPVIQVAEAPAKLSDYALHGAKDVILRTHIEGDLAAKVQLAARRARLFRSMRAFLLACNGESVRDKASGAFTATFLAEHGARLCARANHTGRPIALTSVQLAVYNTDDNGAPGTSALHQAARLINRVTRADDLVARIGPDRFLVLSPATTAEDANYIATRIEGVLTNTVFRGARSRTLYAVKVATTVCERPIEASIEESVALVLKTVTKNNSVTQPRSQSPQ